MDLEDERSCPSPESFPNIGMRDSVRTVSLHFTVSDTGIGIPAEKQGMLFSPLVQADSSLKRRHEGTGLGLAISARLVQLMDGRIWFESKAGHGSTFHFTARFGLSLQTSRIEAQPSEATITNSWPEDGPRNLRILLAEDNIIYQKVVVGILEKWGHRVVVAGNGRQAVKAYREQSFDLALMDVRMPEMDGLEATDCIREWEQQSGSRLPIIALTAQAMKGDQEHCLQAGCDAYLSKPIKPQELSRVMLGVISGGAGVRTISMQPAGFEQSVNPQVLNRERFVSEGVESLREFVRLFQERIPQWLADIGDAIASQDAAKLFETAHSLKGATLQFGVRRVSEVAIKLEIMGRECHLADAEEAFRNLKEEMETFQGALTSLQKEFEHES